MPKNSWFVLINALGFFETHAQSLPWPFFAWTREAQHIPTFRPQQSSATMQAHHPEFGQSHGGRWEQQTLPIHGIATASQLPGLMNQAATRDSGTVMKIESVLVPEHSGIPAATRDSGAAMEIESVLGPEHSGTPDSGVVSKSGSETTGLIMTGGLDLHTPDVSNTQTPAASPTVALESDTNLEHYGIPAATRDSGAAMEIESVLGPEHSGTPDSGVVSKSGLENTGLIMTGGLDLHTPDVSNTQTQAASTTVALESDPDLSGTTQMNVAGGADSLKDSEDTILASEKSFSPNISRSRRWQSPESAYYDGFLPLNYFNQGTTSSTNPPLKPSEEEFYRPYDYNLTEFLEHPAIGISPYTQKPKDLNIYCYPFDESEILGKCKDGVSKMDATGVMIPLMNEIQTPKSAKYYDNLLRLKGEKSSSGEPIKIYGVAYDNPAWELIDKILREHKRLFDGLILEWVGAKACPWNINSPTRDQVENIAENAGLPIQYFARQQDCDPYVLSQSANGGSFFNPNDAVDTSDLSVTKGLWPRFLKYIFPCFQGEEGPCYHAIRNHPEKVCGSDLQKFAYSPFEALGGLMMYLKNETCHGLGDHDLYSVV